MTDNRLQCPHCGKRLRTSGPLIVGDRFRCPGCTEAFHVPPPATSGLVKVVTGLFGLTLFVLALGVGIAVGLSGRDEKKPDPQPEPVSRIEPAPPPQQVPTPAPSPERREEPPPPREEEEEKPIKPAGYEPPARTEEPDRAEPEPAPRPEPPPPPPAAPPPLKGNLPADVQTAVDKAVAGGLAYLRKKQTESGSWQERGEHAVAMAALPALTMLECGVDPEDPAVRRALAFIRREAPRETMTYDLSLTILFLDRLNDPQDRRLIQTLALRLLSGQNATGGWTYRCPGALSPGEELVFFDLLERTRPKDPLQLFANDVGESRMAFFIAERPGQAMSSAPVGMAFGSARPPDAVGRISSTGLDPATSPLDRFPRLNIRPQDIPAKLHNFPVLQPIPAARELKGGGSDNSNTQFAILGVWAAARHAVPVERSLALMTKRFRMSQNDDGSWGYHFSTGRNVAGSPAMNCVGLLGLAVGHGLVAGTDPSKARQIMDDPAVIKGLAALEPHLTAEGGPPGKGRGPKKLPRAALKGQLNCYFLWSVERVGVLYDLPKIGDTNWYDWGVDILLGTVNDDGSWSGKYNHGCSDTCLALLFLRRANLTRDLSAKIYHLRQTNELKGRLFLPRRE